MVRKAAGEYSKTKEEQLGQAVKAAFDWFSTCYGAITLYMNLLFYVDLLLYIDSLFYVDLLLYINSLFYVDLLLFE